ncbi:MAG: hypothetical protein RIT28_1866 [Pseudomonadota bacterium]
MSHVKIPYALIIAAVVTACADKGATDTADSVAPIDSVDSEDSADSEDSEVAATVPAYVGVLDMFQAIWMPGATVTIDGESMTADAEGYVVVDLPQNELITVQGAAPGYMNSTLVLFTLDDLIRTYVQMLPIAVRDAFSAQLGVPYDETKGFYAVQVYSRDEDGASARLAGATVELDVPYSVALSSDLRSPSLVVPSNVTVTEAESNAQIIFINVEAGPVTTTVTPPAPYTSCYWYRGDTLLQDYSVEIAAGVVTSVFVYCE